jgi:ribosome-associated heat shock protein Hsp15
VNGRPVQKASQTVKPGDELVFPLGRSWRKVRVRALGERRGPAPEARELYEELASPDPPMEHDPLYS